MLVTLAVLVPIHLVRRRGHGSASLRSAVRTSDAADRARLLAIGVIGTFGFSLLMYVGMRRAPGSVAAVVMAMTPAVTAVGAAVFLSERFGTREVLAVALAVVGVVVVNLFVTGEGGDDVAWGSVLVFGAVCCEATYTLVGKRMSVDLDPLSMTIVAAVIALVAFLPLGVTDASGFDWTQPDSSDWLALIWWGAGTMGAGSLAWFAGMARAPASVVPPFMGVMPVSALALSYVLLDESFRPIHLVALGCVLAAIALVALPDSKP